MPRATGAVVARSSIDLIIELPWSHKPSKLLKHPVAPWPNDTIPGRIEPKTTTSWFVNLLGSWMNVPLLSASNASFLLRCPLVSAHEILSASTAISSPSATPSLASFFCCFAVLAALSSDTSTNTQALVNQAHPQISTHSVIETRCA